VKKSKQLSVLFFVLIGALLQPSTALTETLTAEVSGSLHGVSWELQDGKAIGWADNCVYNKKLLSLERVCERPYFWEGLNSDLQRSMTRLQYKLRLDGIEVKQDKTLEYSDYSELFDRFMKGDVVTADLTIITTNILANRESEFYQKESTQRYTLKGFVPAYNEYKDDEAYYFEMVNGRYFNKRIAIFFGGLFLLYILYFLIPVIVRGFKSGAQAATNKAKLIGETTEKRRHDALVKQITEEEQIRKQVREGLAKANEAD
jgi:hypothetical protein